MKWRFLNIGVNHQSNGRSDPYSRSWNRIYAQFGLEGEDFALLIKPWYRIPEKFSSDDNRDILDYIGRGEVLGIWKRDGHVLSLTLRHSLRFGDSRGSAAIDWAFPLQGFLRATCSCSAVMARTSSTTTTGRRSSASESHWPSGCRRRVAGPCSRCGARAGQAKAVRARIFRPVTSFAQHMSAPPGMS